MTTIPNDDKLFRNAFDAFPERILILIAQYDAPNPADTTPPTPTDFLVVRANNAARLAAEQRAIQLRANSISNIYPAAADAGLLNALIDAERSRKNNRLQLTTIDHTARPVEFEIIPTSTCIYLRERDLTLPNQTTTATHHPDHHETTTPALLTSLSHAIRTPMSAILGYTDIIATDLQSDHQLHAIDTIRRNSRHLLALVDDLLELASLNLETLQLPRVHVDLQRLIDDTIQLMRPRADAEDVSINAHYPDRPLPNVTTDPNRLKQIITLLLTNAVDATSVGNDVTIRLAPNPPATPENADQLTINLDIIDQGVGLTPQQRQSLLDPSLPTPNANLHDTDRTPLAPSIIKQLAKRLGGTIELIKSEPSLGTHIRLALTLPIAPTQSQTRSIPDPTLAEPPPPFANQPRILVAEDAPDSQKIIRHHLERAGAQTTIAPNGAHAVRAAIDARDQANPFDLILLDMQMPVCNGPDAARQLREAGITAPIVALTACNMPTDRNDCLNAGCDDFLTKPATRDDLLTTCHQWLDRASTHRAA